MASPIWISNDNTPQPPSTTIRDGSNARNAIVIDDNDEGDVSNQTVPPGVGVRKPDAVILDLTGSATPPASRPPEGVAEPPGSEVPVESADQPTYTSSRGSHAHAQQTERSPPVATNDELPDTAINSTIVSSQDKTPSLSQERSSAERPSPQRHNSRPRTKERNGQFRSGSARRGVGSSQLWDDDDIATVGRRSTPAPDFQAESYCKNGRLVQCPGQHGIQSHQTTYSEQKVSGVMKYWCFPGCGYTVSVAEYKEMVLKNLMRGALSGGAETMSDDAVEKELVTVEKGDKNGDATEVDGPGPTNLSQSHQDEHLDSAKSPSEPLKPSDTEVAMVEAEAEVEKSDSGSSLSVPVAPADKPVVEILTVVDECVPPLPVDDSSATKAVSESSKNIVEQISDVCRTEDISGVSEPPTEGGPAAELPAEIPAPPAEHQQPTQNPPISPALPPSTLPSTKENTHETDNPSLDVSLTKDSIDPENREALQPSTTLPNPEENTTEAASPAVSTTPTDSSRPRASSRSKISRRLVPSPQPPSLPAPVENTPTPPTTRSSMNKDVCIACRRENGALSADHPVKCQVCKRAWHRSCNAGLENMGYKVTSWTCRSCSRSRKTTTKSGTPSGANTGSTGKRVSRQSLGSSAKRSSGGLYGLGPKKRNKDTVRRASSHSPSITLATPMIENAEEGIDKDTTEDAPGKAKDVQLESRRNRDKSLPPRREERVGSAGRIRDRGDNAPSVLRTRRSASYQKRNKSPSPNSEGGGKDDEENSTSRARRVARLERGSLEKDSRKKDQDSGFTQAAQTSRKRHVSPTVEPELGEQDTTLVADPEHPSKRQRVESPSVVLNEEILNEEPTILDKPHQEVEEQVVEDHTVAAAATVEAGEAENGVIEQDDELTEPVDGSKAAPAPARNASTSPKIGKFKPLPTQSLMRLSDIIFNSGTTLEPPRSEEPETPTPEQPQAQEGMFMMNSPQAQDLLSLALGQGVHLPTDMPCDIRAFEETEPLSPSLDPGDIDIDAEFETFHENYDAAEDEVRERYKTQVEELESYRPKCSLSEEEAAKGMALADHLFRRIEEQQDVEEELKKEKERSEKYKRSARKAKEECERLKNRVGILEKQIESSPGDVGSVLEPEGQLASAKTRYEKAEKELSVLKARIMEFERLQRRCETLQNRLNDSKKDYRQLVAETEGQAEKLEAAINEKNDLAQNIESVKSHLDQAKKDSNEANLELQRSKERCLDLEHEVARLQGQASRARLPGLANAGIGGLYDETSKQIEELKDLNTELQKKLDNAAVQSVYAKEEFQQMWKKRAPLRKQRDEALAQNAKLKLSNDNLQKKLDNYAVQSSYTKEQLTDMWKQINNKDTKIKELEEENKKLGEAKAKLEETIQQNQGELEDLKSSNLTYELLKYHYEEEIRTLKESSGADKKDFEHPRLALPNIHQLVSGLEYPASDHAHQRQLDDLELAPNGGSSEQSNSRTEEETSKAKDLEDELERRKELELSLRERLEAAERRCRELEGTVGVSRQLSSPGPRPSITDYEFEFGVSHPMMPQSGVEVDAVGELPEGHRVRTSQPRKERYEAWYNRNPRALHLHRSCKRDLPSIKGKVKVLEADGSECKTEDDKVDLRGRTRKRGDMTFDEFRGIDQNEVVPVSLEKCGKVVFRKAEKNRRTGGLSRHAVIYKTGRNVPGELRG